MYRTKQTNFICVKKKWYLNKKNDEKTSQIRILFNFI